VVTKVRVGKACESSVIIIGCSDLDMVLEEEWVYEPFNHSKFRPRFVLGIIEVTGVAGQNHHICIHVCLRELL
jgi:hypothetical protein